MAEIGFQGSALRPAQAAGGSVGDFFALTFVLTSSLASRAAAWIFPEHRDIADAALNELPPEARAALDRLWAEARASYGAALCASMAEGDQGPTPQCVDFWAWPALQGGRPDQGGASRR